ncbi:stage II sporulation protein M [Streptococcus danieliae]|uniref:Stage II sporulation protein M n=1 Tax=Streptococcus danieliae TaxID=747656 RepID=A0A7Z0S4S3_9STRE|nr:stage II sporulation protein M [Streptococcus danieliae]MBF0699530.1 stage II sporulation protein M [Streptococcus danieliae]NYS96706.1 stage II sporulation protein M [Streptococcus danieliae]
MSISVKQFYIWVVGWTIFLVLLIIFMQNTNFQDNIENLVIEKRKTFIEILVNNSNNFLMYVIYFPISVFLLLFDLITIGVASSIALDIYGVSKTLSLLPHAILEYPNLLFYSFLSFALFMEVIKNPRISTIKKFFSANYRYYLISYLILIISAFIEGSI